MTDDDRNFYLEDIPLTEAQNRLSEALNRAGKGQELAGELVPLAQALHRITAEPVWAKQSSPHYHAAAMDGYAVNAQDTRDATETRPATLAVGKQAHPVNTGDPLPPGANAVIMIEDVQQTGEHEIAIRASVAPYQHVRLLGEDMIVSELVLPANHGIRPVDLGALAGCGYTQVNVRKRPQVAIIPTGSELVAASVQPRPGEIIEYNSLVLSAQVSEAGGEARVADIVPDDSDALRRAIETATQDEPDLILILSGSSAGSRDFTASVVRSMGALLVHGVAVRPGHPVIIGMIADIPVIGVPGYPVSAALTGELFVQPLLARWLGTKPVMETRPAVEAILTRKLVSPTGDDDFVRVTLAQVGDRLLATPLSRGAGVITSLVRADGLAHIPRFSEGADAGQRVHVRLYQSIDVIRQTVMMMGSHDPMLDLLGQFISRTHADFRLTSGAVGSMGGLVALRRGEAHVVGTHLLDTESGEYNISYVRRYLPGIPLTLVTFAHREQGFLVTKGNPLNIQSFEDLRRVRYVNRQRGAGTRVLLDFELSKRGIDPAEIAGYEHEETTHLGVSAAIASGVADCGMAVRSAALALDLDFVPVGWERYDLVVPEQFREHLGVRHILAALNDPTFRQLLGEQPGYRVDEMGMVQLEIPGER